MKVKISHNKKRNTAFLYETLVRYVTKCVLEEQSEQKKEITSVVRRFFTKGTPLYEELKLYKSVLECTNTSPKMVERVVVESKRRYDKLDKKKIFSEQSKLIGVLNRKYGRGFYDCFIPNYKSLASVSAIFNDSIPVKTKVLLEQNLVQSLSSAHPPAEQHEMMGSNILTKQFIEKFNDKYGRLYEEQKCLLNAFILSLSDDGLSLRAFLNEELGRLKKIITESKNLREIEGDPTMLKNTERVLTLFENFKKKAIDAVMLENVLKIQTLAREIQE